MGALYFYFMILKTLMQTEHCCSFQLGTTEGGNVATTGAAGENTSGASGMERA